jgi:hypothetical protein
VEGVCTVTVLSVIGGRSTTILVGLACSWCSLLLLLYAAIGVFVMCSRDCCFRSGACVPC